MARSKSFEWCCYLQWAVWQNFSRSSKERRDGFEKEKKEKWRKKKKENGKDKIRKSLNKGNKKTKLNGSKPSTKEKIDDYCQQ